MKKLAALSLAFLLTFTLAACGVDKEGKQTTVYSFSGGNEYFRVTNGVIVLDENEEVLNGGDLKITRNDVFTDISFFRTEFYVLKDGKERAVLVSEMHDQTGGSAASVSGDLGAMSGETVITEGRQLEEIDLENNLFFKLTIKKNDGTSNTYTVQMVVEKIK